MLAKMQMSNHTTETFLELVAYQPPIMLGDKQMSKNNQSSTNRGINKTHWIGRILLLIIFLLILALTFSILSRPANGSSQHKQAIEKTSLQPLPVPAPLAVAGDRYGNRPSSSGHIPVSAVIIPPAPAPRPAFFMPND